MTQPTTIKRLLPRSDSPLQWLVVILIAGVGVVGFILAGRLYAPVDSVITQQACSRYGEELSRPVVDHETSNKVSLRDRVDGHCVFGPVADLDPQDGEALEDTMPEEVLNDPAAQETIQISLLDIETGTFYRVSKWVGVLLQLGAASVAIRIVADPLLERFYRGR